MDVKVYDEKVRELQNYLPFLEKCIQTMAAKQNQADRLQKFKQLHRLIESTKKGQRISMPVIMKVEKAIREIKTRCDTKAIEPIEVAVPVKKEVYDVIEPDTPDSPSPTHSHERTSTIPLIPLERSENKMKSERDSHRYEDNRRHRQDHLRSDRPAVDKYGNIRHESVDRHRSRYEQHERSKSRDRYKSDRRERSDSSERSRHIKNDRNRYSHEDRDSREKSWKSYDQRTDRVIKTERSDRYSLSSQRDSERPNKNIENEFRKMAFNRVGARPTSTIVSKTSDDDKFTEDEVAELMERNNRCFGGDSDEDASSDIKNLTEVRSKLATQIKLAQMESMRKKKNYQERRRLHQVICLQWN